MTKQEITESLDCIGFYCPQPLFQTREKMDSIEIGEILEVFADDPASEEDLKRFVKRTKNELILFETLDDGTFHFLIKKTN